MSNYNKYDCHQVPFPAEGMIQNVAESVLPITAASFLENIIPVPIGEGVVRHGTHKIFEWTEEFDEDKEDFNEKYLIKKNMRTIGMWHFKKPTMIDDPEAKDTIIMYVNVPKRDELKQDVSYAVASITSAKKGGHRITFENLGVHNYTVSERLIIRCTDDLGVEEIITGYIKHATKIDNDTNWQIDFHDDTFMSFEGKRHARVYYDGGSIFKYIIGGTEEPELLLDGLSSNIIPRAVIFLNKLYICNGRDKVRVWDGAKLEKLGEFVWDSAVKEIRGVFEDGINNPYKFIISERTGSFNEKHYQPGEKIRLTSSEAEREKRKWQELTIKGFEYANNDVVITVDQEISSTSFTKTEIYWTPPEFRYLSVINGRLWALGHGNSSPDFIGDPMNVYFTRVPGSDSFLAEKEGVSNACAINIKENLPAPDVLEAIVQSSGYTYFIGRNFTQAWAGETPLMLDDEGSPVVLDSNKQLVFVKILNAGTAHGDLVVTVANDTYMVSNTGMVCLSTYRDGVTELNIRGVNQIDNIFSRNAVALNSCIDYLITRSFHYNAGGVVGFRIGRNDVLCSFVNISPSTALNTKTGSDMLGRWTIFSGDFRKATAFANIGNALYLGCGNVLFKYGDGKDQTEQSYGDNDGKDYIHFAWGTPGIGENKNEYVNKHYELFIEHPSEFALDEASYLSFAVYGTEPTAAFKSHTHHAIIKGDKLNETPINKLYMQQQYYPVVGSMRFLSRRFYIILSGITKSGAIRLKRFNLYGINNRTGAEG